MILKEKDRKNKITIRNVKKQIKGITLIALVVTVIVLLILAGVAINLTVGDNGLFKRAQNAADTWQMAEQNEQSEMEKVTEFIDDYVIGINIEQVIDENPGVLELDEQNIDTYTINSIEDLVFFSYDVTTNGITYEGKTVKLGTNLDFSSDKSYVNPNSTDYEKYGYSGPIKQALISGTGFKPIGELISNGTKYFYGTFDGNNKAICSLYINMNSNENVRAGLFTTSYGEIKNLGLVNTNIKIQGEANTYVGGLIGLSYNNTYNSYVSGTINAIGKGYMMVAGLCGATLGNVSIENCYNLANIESKNNRSGAYNANIVCGGILGQANVNNEEDNAIVNIQRCFNKGNINADGGNTQVAVGGIMGAESGGAIINIKNCYNNAILQASLSTSTISRVGGIAGGSVANLSNCYNAGDIIVTKIGDTTGYIFGIGGIIGSQYSSDIEINNVFNMEKVICKNGNEDFRVGGIVGRTNETVASKVNNAYNTGLIDANGLNNSQVGSIAGNNIITLTNCFYLKGTYDVGVAGSEAVTGVTELDNINEFPTVLNIVNEENVFEEDSNNINGGYPILIK